MRPGVGGDRCFGAEARLGRPARGEGTRAAAEAAHRPASLAAPRAAKRNNLTRRTAMNHPRAERRPDSAPATNPTSARGGRNLAGSEPAPRHRSRGRRLRRRGGERGLTTLEWLLIVAAVAGIAALAVVLVQNVVSDTSEQIAGSSARAVAARLAGEQVVTDSGRPIGDQPVRARTWGGWRAFYESRCKRLEITYGDTGITVAPAFGIGALDEAHDFDNTKVNDGKTATAQCAVT